MAICDVYWPVDFWLFEMIAYRRLLFRCSRNPSFSFTSHRRDAYYDTWLREMPVIPID